MIRGGSSREFFGGVVCKRAAAGSWAKHQRVPGVEPPGFVLKIQVIFDPLRAILGPKTYKYMAPNSFKNKVIIINFSQIITLVLLHWTRKAQFQAFKKEMHALI